MWYRLSTEKKKGDYLYIDLNTKTVKLPRSYVKSTWDKQRPKFFIDKFSDEDGCVYEFNIELPDGRDFPILSSLGSSFRNIGSDLTNLGFIVQKRCH